MSSKQEPPREITRARAPKRDDAAAVPQGAAIEPDAIEHAEAAPKHELSPLGYHDIELPSKGAFYGPDAVIPTPPLPGGIVAIRKMRMAEEEQLASGGGDILTKLSRIIVAVTKLPNGFDPQSLLITDRFYILLALRRIALGPNYPVTFRCSECNAHNKVTINIVEELSLREVADDLSEPVFVDLPDAGVQVGLRFRRGIDEVEVAREVRRAEARGMDAPVRQENLKRQIVEIDGERVTNPMKKLDLVRQLTQTDLASIRVTMGKHEPGVDLTVYPECRRCQFVNEFEMPFTNEFFFPSDL